MAEKISVEIDLEGGKEVENQLADIGKAGQQAFGEIQSAADQVNLSSTTEQFDDLGNAGQAAFNKIQTAAREAVAIEQIVQGIRKVEGAFESLGNAATKMATRMTKSLGLLGVLARSFGPVGIAAGAAGGLLVKFGNDAAKALAELNTEAAKLGLTAQQLDVVQKALAQTGVATDTIQPGLEKFKQSLGEDFTGNVVNALQRFIAQLERMPDGVQRTQLAINTLGDALGGQVIAGLQTGALSAKNFATALGLISPATQAQINEANRYEQALNQLSAAWASLKLAFAPITTPILQFLTQEIKSIDAGIRGVVQTYQTFKAMLSQDFDIPWLAKIVNFDPNLMLSKWLPVLQLIQNALGQGTWPALDALVLKAQQAAQALQQTGQAGSLAAQQNAAAIDAQREKYQQLAAQALQAGQAQQQTGQAGAQAGQQIAAGMQPADQALQSTATQAGATTQAVQQVKAPEASSWTSWGQTVVGVLQSAINKLLEWIGLQQKAGAGGGGSAGGGATGKARGGLIGGRGTGTSDSNLAWLSRGEFVMRAASVRHFGAGFFAALNAGRIPGFAGGGGFGFEVAPFAPMPGGGGDSDVVRKIDHIDEGVTTIINTLGVLGDIQQGVVALLQGMRSLSDALAGLIETAQGTNNMTAMIWGLVIAINEKIDNALSKKAAGGLIGGRGSGTSDSNLAWLSRGEFVIRAAAVRKFGSAFFAALNAGMIPGFALGGMLPRAVPAFAGGGAVGMSHVTIAFPGVPPVSGLRASSAVVEELQRSAALAQVRSGGRKPSRYS